MGREREQEDTEQRHQLKMWPFQLDFMLQVLKFDSRARGKPPLKEYMVTGNTGREQKLCLLKDRLCISPKRKSLPQPTCPSTDTWINKLRHLQAMEFNLATNHGIPS